MLTKDIINHQFVMVTLPGSREAALAWDNIAADAMADELQRDYNIDPEKLVFTPYYLQ